MRYINILGIIMIFAFIFVTTSCNKQKTTSNVSIKTTATKQTEKVDITPDDIEFENNMANNYFGNSLICEKDGSIYSVIGKYFVGQKNENTVKYFLPQLERTDKIIKNIFVSGNWMYYLKYREDTEENSNLYKVKFDGTQNQLICTFVENYIVYKNNIYYISYVDQSLFKTDINGKNKMKLFNEDNNNHISHIYIENNKIHFYHTEKINGTFSQYQSYMNIDGTNLIKTKLPLQGYVHSGWIYYSDYIEKEEQSNIYRKNLKNGKIELLANKIGSYNRFSLYQNNIYYCKSNNNLLDIYKLNLSDKKNTLVYKGSTVAGVEEINVTNDYIYLSGREFYDSHIIDTVRISLKVSSPELRLNVDDKKWEKMKRPSE